MKPATTQYLFFVAMGDGSGRHRFCVDFEQHERNVVAYRHAAEGALMRPPDALRRAVEQELSGCDGKLASGGVRLIAVYRPTGVILREAEDPSSAPAVEHSVEWRSERGAYLAVRLPATYAPRCTRRWRGRAKSRATNRPQYSI